MTDAARAPDRELEHRRCRNEAEARVRVHRPVPLAGSDVRGASSSPTIFGAGTGGLRLRPLLAIPWTGTSRRGRPIAKPSVSWRGGKGADMYDSEICIDLSAAGITVLELLGDHDLSTAEELSAAIDQALVERPGLVIDLSQTTFMDSTVVHLLINAHQLLEARGHELIVQITGQRRPASPGAHPARHRSRHRTKPLRSHRQRQRTSSRGRPPYGSPRLGYATRRRVRTRGRGRRGPRLIPAAIGLAANRCSHPPPLSSDARSRRQLPTRTRMSTSPLRSTRSVPSVPCPTQPCPGRSTTSTRRQSARR